jgi:hypothetical protein
MHSKSWHNWLQDAVDYLDNRYDHIRTTHSETWARRAWRSWMTGVDPIDFVDEFMRDHKREF